jgi:hypothetical protein
VVLLLCRDAVLLDGQREVVGRLQVAVLLAGRELLRCQLGLVRDAFVLERTRRFG